MTILKTIAFCAPLIGLCGIVGAVETGTSPVNASILFFAGCLVMATYIRLMGLDAIIEGNTGKEELMSGMEMEELATRIKGMTFDEQVIVAGSLQDNILWGELQGRYASMSTQLNNIRKEVM